MAMAFDAALRQALRQAQGGPQDAAATSGAGPVHELVRLLEEAKKGRKA